MARFATVSSLVAIAALAAVLTAWALALPVPLLAAKVQRIALPPPLAYDLPPVAGAGDAGRPLVVIDAGHGGFDYGARAPGYDEKVLVLAIARTLRDTLVADGGVRVAMTRDDDSFVSLQERYEAARRLGADLFVSIHADSAGVDNDRASSIEGASIYTLATRASDAAARRFAARENASDAINGQSLSGQSDAVTSILVDLAQRRTQSRSERFADLIAQAGEGRLVFHPPARRSAVLEVLRAPDVPSVLFESGYITNPSEAARLASRSGQTEIARVLARAIRLYFASERLAARTEDEAARADPGSAIASSDPAP